MELKRKAEKLHWQFAHASKEKLISLVRGSKTFNNKEFLDLIQDVCDSCSVYLRLRKPPLQLVVGLTLGNRFNDTVCLDLKEHGHNQFWILHLIDTCTKYSASLLSSNPGWDWLHFTSHLGKVWIQLFSLQLWVNSRADWVLQPEWGN